MLKLLVTFLLCCSQSLAQGNRPILTTNLGVVEGLYKRSFNGREYSSFEGIPFAKPPLGELRFKDPIKAESWDGILNATTTYTCMQQGFLTKGLVMGDEDCLYLNVYVPKKIISSNDNFNVLVHIHGGGFVMGSPTLTAGPNFLMDRDLILVTMNYRLGLLGFLSTEDEVVSGNMGLKDQVMALKWVQENIKQFGGNPDSVTLTGVSAGAGSTHLHYFSEKSRGLFHRGYSQSGNAMAPWAIQDGALRRAKQLAAVVGCDFDSSEAFIHCMRQRSAKQLVDSANTYLHSSIPTFPLALFSPVVEKKSQNAFLVDYPYNLLKSKKYHDLPWISSVTSEEGILCILLLNNKIDGLDQLWTSTAKYLLDYNDTICSSDELEVANRIKSQYFGNDIIAQKTVKALIKLFTDRYFVNSAEEALRLQASQSKSKMYSYVYKYKPSFGDHVSKVLGLDIDYGVNHAADENIIYNNPDSPLTPSKYSEQDLKLKDMFMDMIVRYTNNQEPKLGSDDWLPVDGSEKLTHLSVAGPDNINLVTVDELTPRSLWNSLPILENWNIAAKVC